MGRIRVLKERDLEAINKIYDEGYAEAGRDPLFGDYVKLKKPTKKEKEEVSQRIMSDVRKKNCIFIVAEEDGGVVGFAFVKKRDMPDSELSHVGVLGVRVSKDWRGNGIGTQLIKEALKLSERKFEIVEASVLGFNDGAKRLYKRFGFKRWGIAPRFMKRGRRYVDMEYLYLDL